MNDKFLHHVLEEQDKLMCQLAKEHMQDNEGHECYVYQNFIDCVHCGFHAHLISNNFTQMWQHGTAGANGKAVSPKSGIQDFDCENYTPNLLEDGRI